MPKRILVQKGTYHDSVTLMQVGVEVKKTPGVVNAVVGMGTDFNLQSLDRLGLMDVSLEGITPNDLIIAIEAESDAAIEAGIAVAKERIAKRRTAASTGAARPASLRTALADDPGANVVLISVPGRFAAREVRTALEAGRHVMLFSDNVTIEEELELKNLAVGKGLLMMGPDCGTAIINGVPLAFANKVRRGPIGVVAASGTGLQEATSLIHRFGLGITQAIGVGGRDLSERIGGRMTILAAESLAADPETKVLLFVSKPPAASTRQALFARLKSLGKPTVVYFIGTPREEIEAAGFTSAASLEEAAAAAVTLATGKAPAPVIPDEAIRAAAAKVAWSGKDLRGLYSGGTLCDEAQRMLLSILTTIQSNTPVPGARKLDDVHQSVGHTIVDLGDDDFTRGRAHPMIDPTARRERIEREFADPATGLVLIDVVLGYGSHPDMASEMASAVADARGKTGRSPAVAAAICGTDEDPQGFDDQRAKLEAAGILAFPSHRSMIRFVLESMKGASR
jgi:succinyl-CoA synthetase alpha subunit